MHNVSRKRESPMTNDELAALSRESTRQALLLSFVSIIGMAVASDKPELAWSVAVVILAGWVPWGLALLLRTWLTYRRLD